MKEVNIKKDIIKRFLDEDGKITSLPSKYQSKIEVLKYLSDKFEFEREYTEKQINEIISNWHTFNDYFVLRRALVDNFFLIRTKNGSKYWKEKIVSLT